MNFHLILAAGFLAVGTALGAGLTHWHYAPRLEAAVARANLADSLVREQNLAIAALKDAETERAKAAKAAMAKAEAGRHAAERRAQDLLSRKQPEGVETCDAIADIIRDELAL